MRIHHVQVSCPPGGEDVARRFYGEGLGLPEVPKPSDLAARGGCWFRAADGGAVPRCTSASSPASRRPARRTRPSGSTTASELDATAVRLEALGFVVDRTEEHTFPGHRRFHTHDGHGNRVELLAGF